eukprot:15809228-Heterocapsa_arctica.AAC.1
MKKWSQLQQMKLEEWSTDWLMESQRGGWLESSRTKSFVSNTYTKGLADIVNKVEKVKNWLEGMNPIIALIHKDGADNEGQLRPIAIF